MIAGEGYYSNEDTVRGAQNFKISFARMISMFSRMFNRSVFGAMPMTEEQRKTHVGTIVLHEITEDGTKLTVFTGPAHEMHPVSYRYHLSNKNQMDVSVRNARNGIEITVTAEVPVKVVAKVNRRNYGALRVAVLLKFDDVGVPYFEVHTPVNSNTDVLKSTFFVEKADVNFDACPGCGDPENHAGDFDFMQGMEELAEVFGFGIMPGQQHRHTDPMQQRTQQPSSNGNAHHTAGNSSMNGATNGKPKSSKRKTLKKKAANKQSRRRKSNKKRPVMVARS